MLFLQIRLETFYHLWQIHSKLQVNMVGPGLAEHSTKNKAKQWRYDTIILLKKLSDVAFFI